MLEEIKILIYVKKLDSYDYKKQNKTVYCDDAKYYARVDN